MLGGGLGIFLEVGILAMASVDLVFKGIVDVALSIASGSLQR